MGEPISRGIEVLVSKASVDPEFQALLLERRAAAAESIALDLTPAEAMILAATPREQIEAIIAKTKVPQEHRRAFIGQAAAAMVAAVTASGGIVAAGGFGGTGIRPDKEGVDSVEERVREVVAKRLDVAKESLKRETRLDKDSKGRRVSAAALKAVLDAEFHVKLVVDRLRGKTLGQVVDYVKSAMKTQKSYDPASKGHRPDLPRKRPAEDEAESEK